MSFLGFTSTRLGSEGDSREKKTEDPVRLEPMTPGLRVKHCTIEPRGTLKVYEENEHKIVPTSECPDFRLHFGSR